MARPGDWNALGLDSDPTPGDPDRVDALILSQDDLISLADTIDAGLTDIKNTTDGAFVGETADALRKVIDNDLRNYVSTFRQAHQDAQSALRTYVGVMREQQQRADEALNAAAALAEDDEEGREAHKATADDARSTLSDAAGTAASALRRAAESIASPVDECEEFWKALGWLALILVIPAMIVGGPLALFTIGLNVALLIKTAVDFSQGKASVTDLVLSILGVIAPTTKGIRLGDLWKGLKSIGVAGLKGGKELLLGGPNALGLFGRLTFGLDNTIKVTGVWMKGIHGLEGVRFTAGFKFMPGVKGFTMGSESIATSFRFVPAAAELTVINLMGAKTFFGLRSLMTGLNGLKGLGSAVGSGMLNSVRGLNGLRLFLPVAGDELGHGLAFALKVGVIDRGIFGMYRYGAFAGGHFLGAGSKISGGVAAGLDIARAGEGLGSLSSLHLSQFVPNSPGSGLSSGLGTLRTLSMGDSIGTVALGDFHGISSLSSSTPGIGARLVDLPTPGGLSGMDGIHLPQLGPVSSVSTPGLNGLNVPSVPAAGHGVGSVTVQQIGVPHLNTPGSGVTRIEMPSLGGEALATPAVHTPSVGAVHVPSAGLADMPSPGQINVPSLGSVAHGPTVTRIDTPGMGARLSDLPAIGGMPRVDVPPVARVEAPAAGASSTGITVPSVGRVDVPGVSSATGGITAPSPGRVDVPGVGTSANGITTPSVGHVDVPGGNSSANGITTPSVGQVHVPGAGGSGIGIDVPAPSRVEVPSVGQVDLPAIDVHQAESPAVAAPHLETAAPHAGTVHAPAVPVAQVDAPSVHAAAIQPPALSTTGLDASAPVTGRLDTPAVPPAVSVSHITPTPAPTPATTGGLAAPGPGALVADPFKLGRVDLAILAHQTIEVRMMQVGGLNFEHTFAQIDPSLPGVRVEVHIGNGPHGTNLTVHNPQGVPGVTAVHEVVGGQDVLRVERGLPGGGTDRWNYALQAPDYPRLGDVQHLPAGASDDIELMPTAPRADTAPAPAASGAPALVGPSNAVPAPVPGPALVPAPAVHSRVLDLPGTGGHSIEIRFGETPGRIVDVRQVVPDGGTPVVHPRVTTDAHGAQIVNVRQPVNAVEVRSLDFAVDPNGLRPLGEERLITLQDGTHSGATVGIDAGSGAVRHVEGTAVPGGPLGLHGGELVLPTPGGFQLYDPATGLGTRAGTRLTGGGAADGLFVLPAHDGRTFQITDAGARVHGTVTVTPVQDVLHVHSPRNGQGVVDVHTADGRFSHTALDVQDSAYVNLANHHLVDAAGNDIPGATVRPQPHGYRIDDGTHHLVADAQGVHTHDVVTLQGTGDLVHLDRNTGIPMRLDADGHPRGPITRVGDELHVPGPPHHTSVHDLSGAHTHDLLDLHGGPFDHRTLHVDLDGTGALGDARVVRQHDGSFRIQEDGHHAVVDADGRYTHDVVPLQGTQDLVHLPVGGGAPLRVNADGIAQGPVTRVGNEFHVPAGGNRTTVYDGRGVHTDQLLTVQDGLYRGRDIHLGADGATPRLDGARVVPGADGFRVQGPHGHIALDAQGGQTGHVVALAGTDHLVHVPTTAGGAPTLHAADGAPVPHHTLTSRADGTLVVDGPGGIRVHGNDGTLLHTLTPLADGTAVRLHPGGGLELLDGDLAKVADNTVTARPGGGFRVTTANGEVRLHGAGGGLEHTITPPADGAHIFHVTDAQGAHQFDMVQLSDSVGTRFVRTDTHALLDGDLTAVPPAGHGTFAQDPGGGYRFDHTTGPRSGEFTVYDVHGKLTEQRINVIDKGVPKPNEHLLVTHPADGSKPTWQRVTLDGAGQAVAQHGARHWYDFGTVETKGLGNGRVKLLSGSGVEVMERRPLPNGHSVDAYHSTAGVGTFGRLNQRGVWTEFDANGGVARVGTRHWGESGRSWFDVTTSKGVDTRVRHFQENPDGGHVLANLDRHPFAQSLATTDWTRFDAEFKEIAHGTRSWGPGRGYTDTMIHPHSGDSVVAHEKWGRFTLGTHDVRRYHQLEIGADGVPKKDFTSWSAHGKENGRGLTLKNGDFLESRRFAEQRPPVAFRWLASGDYRAVNFDNVPWLAKDSKLQIHHWTQTSADGKTVTQGVRFVSQNGAITDIARDGEILRDTRKLLGGDTVTAGDVKLPDGVGRRDGHLPWSQGEGRPQGHRTFDRTDFADLPGVDTRRIRWQDKVTDDLADGDWYTPNAGKQWNVVRVGLDDGTVIDYRPAPGPDARTGHAGAGDWTHYDHHGLVVARQDTWPEPHTGGGLPVQVTTTDMLRGGELRWHDSLGNDGVRKLNFNRGDMTRWGWDRESYQDFLGDRLIREHHLFKDGTTVDAWAVHGPGGRETWHWNKTGADGEIKAFGTGPADRVRHWFDADGNGLMRWEPGARWEDHLAGQGNLKIQEIPAKPAGAGWFTDAPHRVREYLPDPGGTHNPHVFKEYENGLELGRKVELSDGTFLESEDWHKQWRRFGADGVTMIDERTIPGYVWHTDTDTFGRTDVSLIGRETNFTGAFNEYRGYSRMLREVNRWEWGATANGVSTTTPFLGRVATALAVEFVQEWVLDFTMNLIVSGIVSAVNGTPFTPKDVARAAFGATVGASVKGTFSAGHFAAHRGGPWKTGLSQIDQGNPFTRRPNDDSWAAEFAGNEKVTRWRSGTYDFGVGLVSGAVSGFVGGAASSAIFGVKDKDGHVHHLSGADALLAGALGAAGSLAGALTTGLGRTMIIQNLGGRWYHRQGFFDIFAVGGLGKLVDKIFSNLYLSGAIVKSAQPGYYQGSGEAPGANGGQ
ncbi:hypothetical protein [Streptomyces sp. SID2888]|uniref:hypothetical protein n=1 Tax=Streptomyces sp. SID2888 TaxID=2690256 RepID=UPI00136FB2EC|nr:hypothetical protein [Streptomyces sp. SID2888]MYV48097.1 hypothetical protein [Streptomyces sp. SID2888]